MKIFKIIENWFIVPPIFTNMLEKFPDCLEWKEDDVIKIDHEAWYRASLVTVDEKGCWCKPINNNVIFVETDNVIGNESFLAKNRIEHLSKRIDVAKSWAEKKRLQYEITKLERC